VDSLTLADLSGVDVGSWKGPKFAGECVPTLANALDLLKQNPGAHCFVELKCGDHCDAYAFTDVGLPAAAADVAAAAGIGSGQLTWISFSLPALVAVKQHSTFPTLLIGMPDSEALAFEMAEMAVRNGFDGIDLRADPAVVTPALVDWLKEREKSTAVWVNSAPAANDNEQVTRAKFYMLSNVWNAMAEAGVETLTSNLPPEIHKWKGGCELEAY
jgi:glycerophosphoryl diester phosphodiesterase